MRVPDQAFHRLSVLKTLRAGEPISRTDLASVSGLNGGTITAIARDLATRGLILEERVPSPGRGRPRINLHINPQAAYVVGVTMTDDRRLLAEVVDLRGQSICSHTHAYRTTTRPENLARQFARAVNETIAASPVPREKVARIGVGLPAIIDSRTGIIQFFETFGDVPFPFAKAVENELHIPVRVDNNINLLARSEHWFGGGGADDFTLVLLDLGLGGARYQSGQLLLGSHWIEAELGHTKIVPEGGRACHCGARGCLQSYSSMSAIAYQAAELAGEEPPGFFELRAKFDQLAARAIAGDAAMAELFDRAGRYLGRGLANHINMQDPERIVLLTRRPDLATLIAAPFFAALHRDTLPVLRDLSKVAFKPLCETDYTRGAAAMVLEELYLGR